MEPHASRSVLLSDLMPAPASGMQLPLTFCVVSAIWKPHARASTDTWMASAISGNDIRSSLVRCFFFLLLFVLSGGRATASGDLYLTGFCKSVIAELTVADVDAVETLVRGKAERLAPFTRDASLVYQTRIPDGIPFYDLWIVTRPSGSIASCSGFWQGTDSANPDPNIAVTNEAESDPLAPNIEAALFEQSTRSCGTACGSDSITIVVTGERLVRELFVSPIQRDDSLGSRLCPMEFRFELDEVRLGKERVGIAGSITGNIYCEWSDRVCSLFLPRTDIQAESSKDERGVYTFDIIEVPIFKKFIAVQDALLDQLTFGSGLDQEVFERCEAARLDRLPER